MMDPEEVVLAVVLKDNDFNILVTANDSQWEIHAHSDKEDWGTTGACWTPDPKDNFIFALHRAKDKFPDARVVIDDTRVPECMFRKSAQSKHRNGLSMAMEVFQTPSNKPTTDYSKFTSEEWATSIIDVADMHWLVPPDNSTFSYEVTEGLAYAPLNDKIEDVIKCIKQQGYNITWDRKEYSGQKIISIKFIWRTK